MGSRRWGRRWGRSRLTSTRHMFRPMDSSGSNSNGILADSPVDLPDLSFFQFNSASNSFLLTTMLGSGRPAEISQFSAPEKPNPRAPLRRPRGQISTARTRHAATIRRKGARPWPSADWSPMRAKPSQDPTTRVPFRNNRPWWNSISAVLPNHRRRLEPVYQPPGSPATATSRRLPPLRNARSISTAPQIAGRAGSLEAGKRRLSSRKQPPLRRHQPRTLVYTEAGRSMNTLMPSSEYPRKCLRVNGRNRFSEGRRNSNAHGTSISLIPAPGGGGRRCFLKFCNGGLVAVARQSWGQIPSNRIP